MTQTDLVSTNIRLTPEQREFIHNSEYSLSKLVRTTITKLMENANWNLKAKLCENSRQTNQFSREILTMDNFTNKNSFVNNHANIQSLTLIPKTNAKLTLDTNANHNHRTKSQKHFYDRAESICKIEQRLFCCEDFTLSKSNFRQKILE